MRSSLIQFYWVCDALSGTLIFLMVIFGPWAFGTTQSWSVWTMNVAGFALGLLLVAKLSIRRFSEYKPPRWGGAGSFRALAPHWLNAAGLTNSLAFLTIAIVGYCLVSAFNARSTFQPAQLSFAYHAYCQWLPHSFDSTSTWVAFWTCLGLACSFWSVRDWLLGKAAMETDNGQSRSIQNAERALPARLRGLLWMLAINGGLLGLEAILQRFDGGGRLLFVIKPRFNPEAVTQFGPYAYRGNAAQYFNLLWPVCLGFWWTLRRSERLPRVRYHLLLACAALMAACPIISTSRGGVLVCLGLILAAPLLVVATDGSSWRWWSAHAAEARPRSQQDSKCEAESHIPKPVCIGRSRRPGTGALRTGLLVLAFLAAAPGIGFWLGWKALKPRLAQIEGDFVSRQQIYDKARPMAADYPWFGTGPGTFERVFQFYRKSTDSDWPAQLHDDWLETRITFGRIGSGLLGMTLGAVLLLCFAGDGIQAPRRLAAFIWLALAGVLLHARFDFPFQVHSIVFLFVVLCGVLSALSSRKADFFSRNERLMAHWRNESQTVAHSIFRKRSGRRLSLYSQIRRGWV